MIIVAKMPNWAAAPKKIMSGFLKRGPKSIIAPTPDEDEEGKGARS